jgi:hypothetical protein
MAPPFSTQALDGVCGCFTPEERSSKYRIEEQAEWAPEPVCSKQKPRIQLPHTTSSAMSQLKLAVGMQLSCVDCKVLGSSNTKLPVRLRCEVSQKSQEFL